MANAVDDLAVIISASTTQLASDLRAATRLFEGFRKSVEKDSSGFRLPAIPVVSPAVRLSYRATAFAVRNVAREARGAAAGIMSFASRAASTTVGLAAYETGVLSLSGAFQTLKESVNLAADLEQTTVSFEVMMNSASRAKSMVGDLRQWAAKTPFNFRDATDAARQLMAYGVAAEQIIPTMNMLGNISSGLGGKFPLQDISYVFGTLKTQGQAFAKDIYQFTNRGVDLLPGLAKHFGVLKEQVRGLVETGQVGFNEVQKALEALQGPGGKFSGMMDRQAKTMKGLLEIAHDAWDIAKTSLGQAIIDEVGLKEAAQDFESFAQRIESAINDPNGPIRKAIRFMGQLSKSAIQISHDFAEAVGQFMALKMDGWEVPRLDATGFGADLFEAIATPIAEAIDWLREFGKEFRENIIEPMKGARAFANDNWLVNGWAFGRDSVRAGRDAIGDARQWAGRAILTDEERSRMTWGESWYAGGWNNADMRREITGDNSPYGKSRAFRAVPPVLREAIDGGRYGPPAAGESKQQIAERYRELNSLIELANDFVHTKGFVNWQPHLDELFKRRLENFMLPFGGATEADLAKIHPQFMAGTAPDFRPGFRAVGAPDQPPKSNADLVREAAQRQREAAQLRAVVRLLEGAAGGVAGGAAGVAGEAMQLFDAARPLLQLAAFPGAAAFAQVPDAFYHTAQFAPFPFGGSFPPPPQRGLRYEDRPSVPTIELANRLRDEHDPIPALKRFKKQLDDAVRFGLLGPNGERIAERAYANEVGSVAERLGVGGPTRLPDAALEGTTQAVQILNQWASGGSGRMTTEQLLQQIAELLRQANDQRSDVSRKITDAALDVAVMSIPLPRK